MVNFGSKFKGNQESIYTYGIMMAIVIVLRRNTALGGDRNTSLEIIPKHKMATLFCAFKTLTGFGF